MRTKITPSKNICDYHSEIEGYAKEILSLKPSHYETVEDLLSEISYIVDNILTAVEFAMQAGQNMEDRLREYRDAIESLGFRREKK